MSVNLQVKSLKSFEWGLTGMHMKNLLLMERYMVVLPKIGNMGEYCFGYSGKTAGGVFIHYEIYYNRGVAYHRKGRSMKLISDYTRALEL